MGVFSTGVSAIGKLIAVAVLLGAFLAAMAGVIVMSLSGEEITVPEITGKDFFESERELAALGLKIKRRADRPSGDQINTVLEQLPKAGETVKTGQMIFVVVSKAGESGEETQRSVIKDIESDDSEKIEEMISDRPKRTRSNSNTNANAKKKAETTRDVVANTGTSNTASDSKTETRSDEKGSEVTDKSKVTGDRVNRNSTPPPTSRPQSTPAPARDTRNRPPSQP
ncbi:MAG TPA: PASTA domain-containing protein [Pyrinomonadaceae bacterium]|nr:PASTA domain-containing protein [Pyrinomonadaceae bacterium]